MNRATKSIAVLFLTALITAAGVFMIGPQIMVIVPTAIAAGIFFVFRRSFMSLVFFGYPFTFGLISAGIGCLEMDAYEQTRAFAVSVAIGIAGVIMIVSGLWKALPGKTMQEENHGE